MTILLYDYCELEEKSSRQLRVWKAWHLILYALAAAFGIMNYVFLQNTMQLVDNNCVLFPRQLSFKMVNIRIENTLNQNAKNMTLNDAQAGPVHFDNITEEKGKVNDEEINEITTEQIQSNISPTNFDEDVYSEEESRLVLDTSRTLFGHDTDCTFAEYIPILSLIFAAAWATLFTMCPGGGHSKSGLPQPWRILAPALLFSIVMVGLTGHSFTRTNTGLVEFCSAFYNVTNSTTCSSLDPYLELSWNAAWSFGGRAAATRLASAAAWASWACAAALFLARCLAAPDFLVRRTGAYLKDPRNKVTPYLIKSRRQRSNVSPSKRDSTSVKSEPTITTELVTVSIEQGEETVPDSLQATPVKTPRKETIDMTASPILK